VTGLTKFSYGGTAAIVTSMGLIGGLGGTSASKSAIISSLLIIAIADNLTDSLAIHVYQESEKLETRLAFRSTIANFFTRLLGVLTFVLLVVILPAPLLVPVGLAWGMVLLGTLTWFVAHSRGLSPAVEVLKHLGIAVLVIAVSKVIAVWIVGRLS
jgi:VIT1/CCC1 family predicted Fe2+/Mn2+ transporter